MSNLKKNRNNSDKYQHVLIFFDSIGYRNRCRKAYGSFMFLLKYWTLLRQMTSSQDTSTFAISELRSNMQKLLDASLTNSSTTSYSHAWTIITDFAEKYGLCIKLPVMQHVMECFVAYLFSRDYAALTITDILHLCC